MRSMVEGRMRVSILTAKRARRLRRDMSLPEVLLWRDLRRGALAALRFRRQHPIGPYILDFFCVSANLAVEVDGAAHDLVERAARDANRDRWLAEAGIRVLRFNAREVLDDRKRPDVLATIVAAAAPSTAFGGPPPPSHATEEDHAHNDRRSNQ